MESIAFKEWAKSESLVLNAKLQEFDGAVVGFDGEDYLHTLLTNPQTREPLLPALGGLPFALEQHVDSDLENLKKAGIKPMFIFNGLDTACKDRKSIAKESQKAIAGLDEAWRVYDLGRGDDAVLAFGKACTYRTSHIVRSLLFHLHRKGVYVAVAPYSAAAQLVHMEREKYLSAIYGSASVLVFGAEKVLISFDWDSKRVAFISKDQILAKLVLNQSQFVDLCLLAGTSILSPLPEIDMDSTPKIPAARAVMAQAGNDGHAVCVRAKDEDYLALFRKAKAAVKHMVIVFENGEIKQLDAENVSNDTHEFISQRLPEEIFAYQMHGFVGHRVLNWRTRQEVFETPPLDGGNSQVYRELVQEKLRPLRTRTLALLTQPLHRYFSKKEVDLICWFNENGKRPLGVSDALSPDNTRDAESWHVKESLMSQSAEAKQIDVNTCPIQYAIAVLSDETLAKKTVTRKNNGEHSVLSHQKELLSNIMWRFLQDRNYINSDHTLSAWGKALKTAFEQASSDGYLSKTDPPGEAEEAIFLAFELLRMDVLNNKQLFLTPPYSGAPMRGSESDKANVLLISRVACLGTFQHDAIGYTGPLSRHLLAFHQVAAAVRNSLRDLTEIHGCNMMMSGSAVRIRDNADFTDVGAKLPFGKEPDLGLALVVKSHLDELSQEPSRRANIAQWFNHALDISADLEKAWKMWDAINAGVQAADSAILSTEIRNMFANANTWLQEKTKASRMSNGTDGAS
ncbi:xpg i-region [Lecanosticta acicola]|uniref:Xpg i-region n=1 Tax=Lecanosticta acicola TaxID=111012 RepID=A0AAI8YRX0_9PEZI|nr:xpg i-region [Lecanosticta acicola]